MFVVRFSLQILREFPEELRGDISMHLHREILQLPIFESASQVSNWITLFICKKIQHWHTQNEYMFKLYFHLPRKWIPHKLILSAKYLCSSGSCTNLWSVKCWILNTMQFNYKIQILFALAIRVWRKSASVCKKPSLNEMSIVIEKSPKNAPLTSTKWNDELHFLLTATRKSVHCIDTGSCLFLRWQKLWTTIIRSAHTHETIECSMTNTLEHSSSVYAKRISIISFYENGSYPLRAVIQIVDSTISEEHSNWTKLPIEFCQTVVLLIKHVAWYTLTRFTSRLLSLIFWFCRLLSFFVLAFVGLLETTVAAYKGQLLRTWRIFDPQGWRIKLHLLHFQRFNGSDARQYGGCYFG